MIYKILILLLAGILVVAAEWLVHEPSPVHAEEVPEKYRETVKKGLEYLINKQCEDGHWEGDEGKHPTAMTALAGMALLMEGEGTHKGKWKYAAQIRKTTDWLIANSRAERNGLIYSGHGSEIDRYMYGHGLATQFLTWAYPHEIDDARREKLHQVLTRAVKYIANAQSTQGGGGIALPRLKATILTRCSPR
jgi:squalene cyclase